MGRSVDQAPTSLDNRWSEDENPLQGDEYHTKEPRTRAGDEKDVAVSGTTVLLGGMSVPDRGLSGVPESISGESAEEVRQRPEVDV